ncbi:pentatricopeptide repeat protein [Aspergillus saccharolyticus JOP 1030-1]|uniref:Pentatricopeptide repeat protein n=1 Tax=Aspergillus saccharolyticus JOP 1030-1 TaxID=1450539 RepID=A0A318Z3V0_9EURO|nr:pentatricopeptide repeat protein [Aspergillus saccharolyticus JOP 1030-1]PYH41746.1 pentatricopeptide repeat protein [Aspergillus saccharolyticus JOP 1030-1]
MPPEPLAPAAAPAAAAAAAARGTTPAIPSRNALRVLRRLALAGSTVGGFCTIAAITYDVHRRITIAERIVENKRALQTSAPNYDATSAAKRLARMIEAAEAGEFNGVESLKEQDRAAAAAAAAAVAATAAAAAAPPPSELLQEGTEGKQSDNTASASGVFPDMYISLPGSRSAQAQAEKLLRDTRPGPTNLQTNSGLDGLASQGGSGSRGQEQQSTIALQEAAEELLREQRQEQHEQQQQQQQQMEGEGESFTDGNSLVREKEILKGLDHLPIMARIDWLLENNRPVPAAQLFLEFHPETLQGLSEDRKQLAERAVLANCKAENVHLARNVFERVEAVDRVSFEMWRTMILSLSKNGNIESAAAIYSRYMHQFKPTADMVDIILRCLVESRRLTTAKWFLLRNLEQDIGCGLCGAYLTGLWRKTRSIELLNGQLHKLLKVLARTGKKPTDKLFNPVIKAYVEFGRYADAEALAKHMAETYEIPLRCRTKGLLLLGYAMRCDWQGVYAGFEEMRQLGFMYRKADIIPVFDRIFLEFWVTHTGEEIREFLYRYLNDFKIVPDRVLYKHILEALVQKGDREMIHEFLRYGRERKWPKLINEFEFLEMLRARRHALEHSPVGFWQMLQAARMKYGQSAASQRILGYDQHSLPGVELNKMPMSEEMSPFFHRMQEAESSRRPVDQYQKLHRLMAHQMHNGKFVEALKYYEAAKAARFHLKQMHVEMAVAATILEKGIQAARELIESDWRSIRAVTRFQPMFFRQVFEINDGVPGEHIKLAVLRFYDLCSSGRDLIVKHHMLVSFCRRLIYEQKPDQALDLLGAVYASRHRHTTRFDDVCLKMFLRAFALADNPLGVRWCLLTALSWQPKRVGTDFIVEVRGIVGRLRHRSQSHLDSMPNLLKYESYLTRVAGLVVERFERKENPQWEVVHNPRVKQTRRSEFKQAPNPPRIFRLEDVPSMIVEWDEEYELEAALGRNPRGRRVKTLAEMDEERALDESWTTGGENIKC